MMRTIVAGVIAALIAIPAAAQSTELGMMAGFTPATSLDRHAPELDVVSLDGGVTFSISGARFLSEHWGVGVEWAQQLSGFVIDNGRYGDNSLRHEHRSSPRLRPVSFRRRSVES